MSEVSTVERSRTRTRALRGLALAAGVVALVLLGRAVGGELAGFAAWVKTLGALGPLVFVAVYALAVVAFVPGSLLTLAGGAVFGVVAGTAYVFAAATLGACAAFLLSRTVARRAIERRIASSPRFAAIDRAIAEDGRRIVFLLRLSPVFPFTLLNYALGLTRVSFADYALACIGMLPGTLLYVYLGSVAGDLAAIAGGATPARGGWLERGFFLLGLAVTALVTVRITRTARRALAGVTGSAPS
jgi:uncharacterized membrane protein YdjX (TVP38/TMEM64 family)